MERALAYLEEFHRKEPLKAGATRGAVTQSFGRKTPAKFGHFLLEKLLKSGRMELDQDLVRISGHAISMGQDQAGLKKSLTDAYTRGWLSPPNLKDVLAELDVTLKTAQPVLKLLIDQGEFLKVKEDMFFVPDAIKALTDKVVGYLEANEEMGPGEFRELTGLSRKYAIPLLEYLDKEKITVRVGDKRRLRKR